MEFDSKKLAVGSKVIIVTSSLGGFHARTLGTIVNMTPSGFVDVQYGIGFTKRFRRNGAQHEKFNKYNWQKLEVATDEEIAKIEENNARATLESKLRDTDWSKVSTEKLKEIEDILEVH